MQLKDYPRPPDDTGLGVHWGAGDTRFADVARYTDVLKQMKIKWVKTLGGGHPADLHACAWLRGNGIEPVLRLYQHRPHPHFVPDVSLVKQYADVGVNYIEFGNEPNLPLEWDQTEWDKGDQPNKVAEEALRAFDVIKTAGCIPMLPALSPGGNIPHRDFFVRMLNQMQAVSGDLKSVLDGAALAIHPRPLNHPPNYTEVNRAPADGGDTGVYWLEYKWFQAELARRDIIIPMIATEHGYEPGKQDDTTFPLITAQLHAQYNMVLVDQVNTGHVGQQFFAGCFWLFADRLLGNTSFEAAGWLDSTYNNGKELPIVQAMKDRSQALKPYNWEQADVQPKPQPQIPPISDAPTLYKQWKVASLANDSAMPVDGQTGLLRFLDHLRALKILARDVPYTSTQLVDIAVKCGFPSASSPNVDVPMTTPTPDPVSSSLYDQWKATSLSVDSTAEVTGAYGLERFIQNLVNLGIAGTLDEAVKRGFPAESISLGYDSVGAPVAPPAPQHPAPIPPPDPETPPPSPYDPTSLYAKWKAASLANDPTAPVDGDDGFRRFVGHLKRLGIQAVEAKRRGFPYGTLGNIDVPMIALPPDPTPQPKPQPSPVIPPGFHPHETKELDEYEQDMERLLVDLQKGHERDAQAINAFLARRAARRNMTAQN